MKKTVYEMTYSGTEVPESSIGCVPFERKYFEEYMRIYNECFYKMRKALDIKPYNYLSDYSQIADEAGNIYLLCRGGEIIGSVACYGNEIDEFIVSEKHQRKGYGRQLLRWGMNKIRENNSDPITLHVAEWNVYARMLYRSEGFEITGSETIE